MNEVLFFDRLRFGNKNPENGVSFLQNNIYWNMLKMEKKFRFIIIANIVSRFGDSLDSIAYGWLVYGLTNSKSWLAITVGVNMIPTILFQPFGGALGEFLDKKKAVVLCDVGRGIIVFLTALLYICGILRPWNLLVFTFLNSTLEAVRLPSGTSILSRILSEKNYKTAIAFNQGASRMAELIGLGSAAAIISILGVGGAICLDAVSFVFSGMMYLFIKVEKKDIEGKSFSIGEYIQSFKMGYKYFLSNNIAIMVCLVCIVLNITAIPVMNLQIAYISEYLKLGLIAVSFGSTITTIGSIVGSLLLPQLTKKTDETSILIGGGIAIGFIYFLFIMVGGVSTYNAKFILYLFVALIFGIVNALIDVAVQVIFISRISKEFIGRIGGIFNSLACSSIPIGSFIIAGIGSKLSIKAIYILTGLVTIPVFFIISRMKAVKELNFDRG